MATAHFTQVLDNASSLQTAGGAGREDAFGVPRASLALRAIPHSSAQTQNLFGQVEQFTASPIQPNNMVRLQVMDLGCVMDAQAVKKATQPFYSAKIAGRKRGMGLAYAARFVQINGGKLHIESSSGIGTTVTVLLPSA